MILSKSAYCEPPALARCRQHWFDNALRHAQPFELGPGPASPGSRLLRRRRPRVRWLFRAVAQLFPGQQQEFEKFWLAFFINVTQPGAPSVMSRA